jgi:phospholipid/cholesterol/gamma-HCH transport system substrate-binding protein
MRRSEDKTALGVLLLAAIAVVVVAINSGWVQRQFQPGGKTVRAQFADTGQLKKGDKVRVDGVTVGRVKDVTLDADGRSATVAMIVQNDAQPLYANAHAAIKWRTLLGGNFAVTLIRGTPTAGPLGDRAIPLSRTSSQVEIEDVTSFARGASKQGLRVMLRELPNALSSPVTLRDAFVALRGEAPSLTAGVAAIRGYDRHDLRPLVASASRTVRALDAPQDGLRRLVEGAATTVATAASREADLRALLGRGARFQPAIRQTLDELRGTLALADPLLHKLRPAAGDVAPTLSRLRPAVVATDRLLTGARPLTASLRPALHDLAGAAKAGRPLLADVAPGVRRIADRVLPDLAVKDPVTGLRTFEIIGPTLASLNGAGSTFDAEGHLFRFPALGGQRAVTSELPCTTWFGDPEHAGRLVECESLSTALKTYAAYRPLAPNPGASKP